MTEFQVWLWFVVLPGMRDALVFAAWAVGMIAAIVSVIAGACLAEGKDKKLLDLTREKIFPDSVKSGGL